MNKKQRKIASNLEQLQKSGYSFLSQYEKNFLKFKRMVLDNISDETLLQKELRQFIFKAAMLSVFELFQLKYEFTDKEYVDLLGLGTMENLERFKDGNFEEVFPTRFVQNKFDAKLHSLIIKAFDFMVIEYGKWKYIMETIETLTQKLISHDNDLITQQNFNRPNLTSRQRTPTCTVAEIRKSHFIEGHWKVCRGAA